MRVSNSVWPRGGQGSHPAAPTVDSVAYRRYLRYLPESRGGGKDGGEGERGAGREGGQIGEGGGGKYDNLPDVSVRTLVQQYTDMLRARNTSQATLLTARSCSSLLLQPPRRRPTRPPTPQDSPQDSRQGSLESSDGEGVLRLRSFSLPWSAPSWRWASDPNLTAPAQGTRAHPQHSSSKLSSSLARLDSAASDEGCPQEEGSEGPTPPPSPVFRSSTANRLSGLITPFRSLSPASSMGSHLGSVEDLPLVRSMSAGHVLDHWARSHSADSAVEVDLSPAVSPIVGVRQVNDDPGVNERSCSACQGRANGASRVTADGASRGTGEDSRVTGEDSRVTGEDSRVTGEDSSSNSSPGEVVLRQKTCGRSLTAHDTYLRRCGGLNGDVLLRQVVGLGDACLLEGESSAEGDSRRALRTPSVVISDHSGDTVSLTVALASSDFTLDKLGSLQHSASSPTLSDALRRSPTLTPSEDSTRKVSSCSSCSSVSTVDMTTPLTLTPVSLASLMEVPQRRCSDCSSCTNVSGSEDEVEHVLPRPPQPRKVSTRPLHMYSTHHTSTLSLFPKYSIIIS
nr:uncharacterized protein LOC123750987 [Procambarus clarkii]